MLCYASRTVEKLARLCGKRTLCIVQQVNEDDIIPKILGKYIQIVKIHTNVTFQECQSFSFRILYQHALQLSVSKNGPNMEARTTCLLDRDQDKADLLAKVHYTHGYSWYNI